MISALLIFLRMIPGVGGIIERITGKWLDTKVQMYETRWGVTRDVAVAAIRGEAAANEAKIGWLKAVASSRFLQLIVGGFAGPWIIYGWKVIVWDNIIHKFFWDTYGFTPPIGGLVGDWANIILTGIFVTSTGMGLTAMVINKSKP